MLKEEGSALDLDSDSDSNSEEEELTSVFLQNLSQLRFYLSSYFRAREDIEDILQEAYLRAITAGRVNKIRAPKAFLYKVAKNLAINHRTKASNRLTDSVEDFDDLGVLVNTISPEQNTDENRQFIVFSKAVSLLPSQCRQAFVLKKVYGLPNAEIAERMNISVSTVDKHLAKGLLVCRNYLNASGYEFPAAKVAPGLGAKKSR